jgi:hypothetical protein
VTHGRLEVTGRFHHGGPETENGGGQAEGEFATDVGNLLPELLHVGAKPLELFLGLGQPFVEIGAVSAEDDAKRADHRVHGAAFSGGLNEGYAVGARARRRFGRSG